MKKKINLFAKSIAVKLAISLRRFPEALLFAAATVITLIALNHANYRGDEVLERIAMVFALGVPASLIVKVLVERFNMSMGKRVISILAVVGALALYYIFLLQDLNMVSGTRYIATTLALYILFTVIPYFFKKDYYELYLVNIFTRLFVTYLYALILFLGLAFTLFTINTLFTFDLSYKLYFDIWLIVVGIFAPAFFFADIPHYEQELHTEDYSKILKVLLLYIVMPIIVVYTTILYAYFVKILIERQWPQGLVSHLVLWYSIVSIIVILFVYPLRTTNKWTQAFTSYFPKAIIPILFMMFVSMGIRVQAYGLTENRYFVLLAGVWVAGAMFYLGFKKTIRNVNITTALVLVLIISVFGPLSSYSVSRLSQNMRLESLFEKYDMIQEGQITSPSEEISQVDRQNISSIIVYFNRNHELKDIKYIPKNYEIKDIEEVLGFQLFNNWDTPYDKRDYFYYNVNEEGRIINVSSYDYFIDFSSPKSMSIQIPGEEISISLANEQRIVTIIRNNEEIYSQKVDDIANLLLKDSGNKNQLKNEEMTFVDNKDKVTVMYSFKHISGYRDDSKGMNIEFTDFTMFVKIN